MKLKAGKKGKVRNCRSKVSVNVGMMWVVGSWIKYVVNEIKNVVDELTIVAARVSDVHTSMGERD